MSLRLVAQLAPLPVIRAFRIRAEQAPEVLEFVHHCRPVNPLAGVLIDAAVAGQFGGTGQMCGLADRVLAGSTLGKTPVVLAGGLNADNVVAAIRQVRPAAVDTASGVECDPGRKDPQSLRSFVELAARAFKEITAINRGSSHGRVDLIQSSSVGKSDLFALYCSFAGGKPFVGNTCSTHVSGRHALRRSRSTLTRCHNPSPWHGESLFTTKSLLPVHDHFSHEIHEHHHITTVCF